MRCNLSGLSIVFLGSLVTSQSSYQVVPAGHDTMDGGSYSSAFGTYRDMRLQLADGELGNSATRLRGIGFRTGTDQSYSANAGRKYANLSIRLSDCDRPSMTWTFSNNAIGTPSAVFSGAIALPSYPMGGPVPAPWASALDFPFGSVYVHSGTRDLLIDLTMTGGTLDDNTAWPAYSRRDYWLDAPLVGTVVSWGQQYFGDGYFSATNRSGCKDSSGASGQGPYAWTRITRTASNYKVVAHRNRTWAFGYGRYFPPKTPIAFLRGVPLTAGISFPGVTCNKLYVNPSLQPDLRFAMSRDAHAITDVFDYLIGSSELDSIPSNPAWTGITFATQAAFVDSKNGSLRLSMASVTRYPALPLPSIGRTAVLMTDATTPQGYSPTTSTWYFPVIRYTK